MRRKNSCYSLLLFVVIFFATTKLFSQNEVTTILPLNNSYLFDSLVNFSWNNHSLESGTTTYRLELAADSGFATLTDSVLNLNVTNADLNLPFGDYYWRVRLIESSTTIAVSSPSKISVVDVFSLSGMSLFLRADSEVVMDGLNHVSEWKNLVDTSQSAVQLTAGFQPTFVSSIDSINFQPAINLDGTDDILEINTPTAIAELFVFSNWDGGGSQFPDFNGIITGKTANIAFIGTGSQTTLFQFGVFATNTFVNNIQTLDYAPINKFKILGGRRNSSVTFPDMQIGKDRTNTSRHWEGNIAEIIGFNTPLTDSIRDVVRYYLCERYSEQFSLGPDVVIDYGFCDTLLSVPSNYQSYLWSNGDTTHQTLIGNSGTYSLTVTNEYGCTYTDEVVVSYPIIPLTDSIFCEGDSLLWDTRFPATDYSFMWNGGSTDSLLYISSAGNYYTQITDSLGCFMNSDTLVILVDSFPSQVSLGPDKTICQGASLGLVAGNNPVSYLWSTGDTIAQTTVDTVGQYWVQATSFRGCIADDTIQINLNGIAPTVGFVVQDQCSNAPTVFSDTSFTTDGSNIIGRKWRFGDGDTSIVQNPVHQYLTNSLFQVSLEITTDSGCVNTVQVPLQIYSPPNAGFFPITNPICSGQLTSFMDNSFPTDGVITGWSWDFGDLGTMDTSSLQNPSYNFPITNNFNVRLIATSEFNCSDTVVNIVAVRASPVANFVISNQCLTNTTQFSNTSQGNIFAVNWNFGDPFSTSQNNPSHVYANAGVYNVRLIVTESNGCLDTVVTPITIYNNPIASFERDTFCVLSPGQLLDSSSAVAGVITDWDWNVVGHSNQSVDQNPTFTFGVADTGFFLVDLLVLTDFGCRDSIRDSIYVASLPTPDFTFTPTTGAPPLLVAFTNQSLGANLYNWNFGDDSTSNEVSPTHFYVDSSNYSIQLVATNNFGCSDSIIKTILVIDPIVDVAVTNISSTFIPNSDFINVFVQLSNWGTFEVNSLDLEVEMSNSGTVRESWIGVINSGAQTGFQFSSSFKVSGGELPDLICVRALNPNGEVDDVPGNNEMCITVNEFQLVAISPNPAESDMNLSFIIPGTGNVVVRIYNSVGEDVAELFSGQLRKGLVRQAYNLTGLSKGIYVLDINYEGESIREKIILK